MICTKCNKDKGTDFRKNRKVCRECDNEIAREQRKKDKLKKKPEFIICRVCGEKKTDFRINRKKCLDCEREHGRNYRRTTDKAKIWAENNKERMSELRRNYYVKEKENIKEKRRERFKTDEKFKLSQKHRSSLYRFVKGGKTSKYVNCKGEQFRNWLQFQFEEDMTIENYGEVWAVDHVIPVEKFLKGEYSSDVILNWMNIQPIYAKKNLTKNKYIDSNQCAKHLKNLEHYLEQRNYKDTCNYVHILKTFCKAENNSIENICETP